MAIMVTSEALVATAASEAQMVTEAQAAALEAHRVTEARVATETSEAQTVTEARREDLREPLQTADAETGPTTKVVPTIV